MKTGFVFDEKYLQHITFDGHPECSQRLIAILKGLIDDGVMKKRTGIRCYFRIRQFRTAHIDNGVN